MSSVTGGPDLKTNNFFPSSTTTKTNNPSKRSSVNFNATTSHGKKAQIDVCYADMKEGYEDSDDADANPNM